MKDLRRTVSLGPYGDIYEYFPDFTHNAKRTMYERLPRIQVQQSSIHTSAAEQQRQQLEEGPSPGPTTQLDRAEEAVNQSCVNPSARPCLFLASTIAKSTQLGN